jgi:hypothetical protein
VNRSHLTAREAEELYERWYDGVAQRVREAAALAHGRRDRHRSDLADLRRDLGAVELRWLLEPEPEARPGTPAHAAAEADRQLTEAEAQHAWGAHKSAIVYLQQAYIAANRAVELAEPEPRPEMRYERAEGPLPPRPPARAQPDETTVIGRPDGPDEPDDPGWHLPIPNQRT